MSPAKRERYMVPFSIGPNAGLKVRERDAAGLNGGVLLGQDDGGVEIGEDVCGEHALGDGSGFHGIGREGVSGYLGGKGVGSGGDSLVGLEVQPLLRCQGERSELREKVPEFSRNKFGGKSFIVCPPNSANVEASVDVQRDAGVGIGAVSPMDGAVGIAQGEGEWGFPLEVGPVDGHLARIRDRCGGKGPRE